jgi:hypothetical protein
MLLSRLAGNYMGDEGAGMLAEPLGKLTALQQLYLQSTVSGLLFLERIQGHCWLGFCDALCFGFVSNPADTDNHLCAEGARRLAEPLSKLTALQQLDLSGIVSFLERIQGHC